jgi:peptide/nickel transport system ATP-binding protein
MTTSALRDLVTRHPGQADKQPFLEVVDLRVHFPTDDGLVKSVDGLSFAVDRGRTLGIVGESGSGKSVTSLAIMGLHTRPASEQTRPGAQLSGEIYLDGDELLSKSPEYVRSLRGKRMAMIFQDPLSSMNPYHAVGDQIIEAYRIHNAVNKGVARKHAIDMLGRVGIPEPSRRVDDYPHQFSGGMRQRAMIAMALSCDPDLLIADEPTTALDVTVQAQILDLIRDLQSEFNSSVVLITHDLGVVAELSDDVLVMYAGRAMEYGSADQLFNEPAHPYTWGLLGSMPRFDRPKGERLLAITGTPPSLIHVPPGCPFHPRCAYAARNEGRSEEVRPELIPAEPGHTVACHLSQNDREEIWEQEIAPKL